MTTTMPLMPNINRPIPATPVATLGAITMTTRSTYINKMKLQLDDLNQQKSNV